MYRDEEDERSENEDEYSHDEKRQEGSDDYYTSDEDFQGGSGRGRAESPPVGMPSPKPAEPDQVGIYVYTLYTHQ